MKHIFRWIFVMIVCVGGMPLVMAAEDAASFEAPFPPITAPEVDINLTQVTAEFEPITAPEVDINLTQIPAEFEPITAPEVDINLTRVPAEFEPFAEIEIPAFTYLTF